MNQPIEQTIWRWGEGARSIGSLLALARRMRGLRQVELARALHVSNANISRIEHGADLRVSTLVEFARALGMEPVLIPKEHIAAVRAVLDSLYLRTEGDVRQKARFE